MFVSKAHHREVVALLREQLKEAQTERDWYRRTFYTNSGFRYPQEETPNPPAPLLTPQVQEIDDRKRFRLDRSQWTTNDDALFQEHWVPEYTASQKPHDEIEYWYHEEYGHQPPSVAWQG